MGVRILRARKLFTMEGKEGVRNNTRSANVSDETRCGCDNMFV